MLLQIWGKITLMAYICLIIFPLLQSPLSAIHQSSSYCTLGSSKSWTVFKKNTLWCQESDTDPVRGCRSFWWTKVVNGRGFGVTFSICRCRRRCGLLQWFPFSRNSRLPSSISRPEKLASKSFIPGSITHSEIGSVPRECWGYHPAITWSK